jgi:hypothetical protein
VCTAALVARELDALSIRAASADQGVNPNP